MEKEYKFIDEALNNEIIEEIGFYLSLLINCSRAK